MSKPTVEKQPAESRLYSIECAARLADGETVSAASSVTISPTTLSPLLVSGSAVISGTIIQVRLIGGLSGTRYKVTVVYTTSLSNTREAEFIVQLEDE